MAFIFSAVAFLLRTFLRKGKYEFRSSVSPVPTGATGIGTSGSDVSTRSEIRESDLSGKEKGQKAWLFSRRLADFRINLAKMLFAFTDITIIGWALASVSPWAGRGGCFCDHSVDVRVQAFIQ